MPRLPELAGPTLEEMSHLKGQAHAPAPTLVLAEARLATPQEAQRLAVTHTPTPIQAGRSLTQPGAATPSQG